MFELQSLKHSNSVSNEILTRNFSDIIWLKTADINSVVSGILKMPLENDFNKDYIYFGDSRNNIEIWIMQFFRWILLAIPSTYWKKNERMVIMDSYADVIGMKRMSVNYSFSGSFACIQMRKNRLLRLRSVVIFSLVREELKAV